MGSEMDALMETVRVLWPDSLAVTMSEDRGGTSGGEKFVVVPNASSPRLLVPASSRIASSRAIRRFSAALTTREVATRIAASMALRVPGGLSRMPDQLEIVGGATTSIMAYLSDVLGTEIVVSLGIGNERVNRKPVMQVFDRRGRSLAFAKIASTPGDEGDVQQELDAFLTLSTRRLPDCLDVPRLISAGKWNDRLVLVMSSLETTARQRPGGQWVVPYRAMRDLSAAFASEDSALVDCELWGRMTAFADSMTNPGLKQRFQRALAALEQSVGKQVFPIGAWHGDWTPWNMSRVGNRIQLWDWERFATGVPQGLDALHFGVNVMCRRHGVNDRSVRAGLALAGAENSLRATYLAAISARYLAAADHLAGKLVQDRAVVMLRGLEEQVGRR